LRYRRSGNNVVRRAENDLEIVKMGTIQFRKGALAEAAASAQRSLDLHPDYPAALDLLARSKK